MPDVAPASTFQRWPEAPHASTGPKAEVPSPYTLPETAAQFPTSRLGAGVPALGSWNSSVASAVIHPELPLLSHQPPADDRHRAAHPHTAEQASSRRHSKHRKAGTSPPAWHLAPPPSAPVPSTYQSTPCRVTGHVFRPPGARCVGAPQRVPHPRPLCCSFVSPPVLLVLRASSSLDLVAPHCLLTG